MNRINKILLLLVALTLSIGNASAQIEDILNKVKEKLPKSTSKKDNGPKPYKDVITSKAKTQKGFFIIHEVEDKHLMEIPDSLLGRDILIVNRISKAAAGVRAGASGYAGDFIGENVVRFEKGPSDNIFIRSISYNERASDTLGMYQSVLNSTIQPIVAAFEIKAYHRDSVKKSSASVIDIQDYIKGDNELISFDSRKKKELSVGSQALDRSYVLGIKAFDTNIEIKTVKTFKEAPKASGGSALSALFGGKSDDYMTFELNSSILILPKKPMKPRYADDRVGYFATGYIDYDANPQGVKRVAMITRFKLEPKPEDRQRYLKGELVEPVKPIVFYIDPATPKKWVPYLIKGVNDWQVAFEQAGFKNAIMAKEAPTDNPSWSLDDAKHNAIVYKPSSIANASGPHVHDPRSGQVMETHINWYHNVMEMLKNWYVIQAGNIDPRARKAKLDDALMGELIRFVSSHEVGHTLGLRHNFGSSSTVPVENLRNKKWVEKNGHTPSIMDYARFNYVAQPEDNIGEKGIFPRIGDYDKWAIEWGYKWMPEKRSTQEEETFMNRWIIERTSKNKRLWFGSELENSDPRKQSEDLGDNAMLASTYGIENLKRIIPNIFTWTREPNEGYTGAANLYKQVVNQLGRYMGHVTTNVGGTYYTPMAVEETGQPYVLVPYQLQKEAVAFLGKELFETPKWLINEKLIKMAGVDMVGTISTLQNTYLDKLQAPDLLNRLINTEATTDTRVYGANELMTDLKNIVWSDLGKANSSDLFKRNLQKKYIANVSDIISDKGNSEIAALTERILGIKPLDSRFTDLSSLARIHLTELKASIVDAIPSASGVNKAHLQHMEVRIDNALKRDPFAEPDAKTGGLSSLFK